MNTTNTEYKLSSEELSFAIFCIENLAQHLHIDTREVYSLLTEKSNLLYDYIIPCYDSLHTQDREYILNDIVDVMKQKGVLNSVMTANPILLQRKYARVVEAFAAKAEISMQTALDFFYHSEEYKLLREGVSDLHCMSDDYLAEDLLEEWNKRK